MIFKCVFSLILAISLPIIETKTTKYVHVNGTLFDFRNPDQIDGNYRDWAALASFDGNVNRTGWAQLEITSNSLLDDDLQAYSSGLIEGYLTSELIQNNWNNNIQHYCDNSTDYCNRLFAFIQKNIEFTKSQIEKFGETDPYWHQIKLSLIQLTGIEDGFKASTDGFKPLGPRIDISSNGLILLNLITEFGELEEVLQRKVKTIDLADGHCSAIIKVLEDGSDLFVAHNTWTSYSAMLRVLKRYNFNYKNISGSSVAFTSYPGVIFSIDDFYMISSGLTVIETSIGNYNNSLWQYIKPEKIVFEFIRNTVANRLAQNGSEWTRLFSKYNSGTYNNQFMIIDYKLFQKGIKSSDLSDNLLWVLEQMPGYVESGDVTQVLRNQGYWPSYNVPYFKFIYDLSDQESQVRKYGDFFTYNRTARALIFKRDHKKALDLKSLYKLMRYNDFRNDPLSQCNCTPPYTAEYALAARCDLNDPNGSYPFRTLGFRSHGAIDVKVTNHQLFSRLELIANSGPSYEEQPPFQWSNTNVTGVGHSGQPDLFRFPAVYVKWSPPSQTHMDY